jgi:hypothetical protein
VPPLLDDYRPALTVLAPALTRIAAHLDPEEVQALITLIDRLPTLVVHLDEDVLPVLVTLGDVVPDVHALLDTVQDMRQIVKGFPGSRLFRRRGAEEIAADEEAAESNSDGG